MAINLNTISGKLTPIGDRVIVKNMYFGEQKTKSGLIIVDDNGQSRGIYPRWGQVHSKGPDNTEEYSVGDWILIEHGRWTRGIEIKQSDADELDTIRMVEVKSVLLWSDKNPNLVN